MPACFTCCPAIAGQEEHAAQYCHPDDDENDKKEAVESAHSLDEKVIKAKIQSAYGLCIATLSLGPTSHKTGILIHEDLILTTHCNLPNRETANYAEIVLCLRRNSTGNNAIAHRTILSKQLVPHRFFLTNAELDLTLVACEAVGSDIMPLHLETNYASRQKLDVGHKVYVLGHLQDIQKKGFISVGQAQVCAETDSILRFTNYRAEDLWLPGSAGFDAEGNFSFMVIDPEHGMNTTSDQALSQRRRSFFKKETALSTQLGVPISAILGWMASPNVRVKLSSQPDYQAQFLFLQSSLNEEDMKNSSPQTEIPKDCSQTDGMKASLRSVEPLINPLKLPETDFIELKHSDMGMYKTDSRNRSVCSTDTASQNVPLEGFLSRKSSSASPSPNCPLQITQQMPRHAEIFTDPQQIHEPTKEVYSDLYQSISQNTTQRRQSHSLQAWRMSTPSSVLGGDIASQQVMKQPQTSEQEHDTSEHLTSFGASESRISPSDESQYHTEAMGNRVFDEEQKACSSSDFILAECETAKSPNKSTVSEEGQESSDSGMITVTDKSPKSPNKSTVSDEGQESSDSGMITVTDNEHRWSTSTNISSNASDHASIILPDTLDHQDMHDFQTDQYEDIILCTPELADKRNHELQTDQYENISLHSPKSEDKKSHTKEISNFCEEKLETSESKQGSTVEADSGQKDDNFAAYESSTPKATSSLLSSSSCRTSFIRLEALLPTPQSKPADIQLDQRDPAEDLIEKPHALNSPLRPEEVSKRIQGYGNVSKLVRNVKDCDQAGKRNTTVPAGASMSQSFAMNRLFGVGSSLVSKRQIKQHSIEAAEEDGDQFKEQVKGKKSQGCYNNCARILCGCCQSKSRQGGNKLRALELQ